MGELACLLAARTALAVKRTGRSHKSWRVTTYLLAVFRPLVSDDHIIQPSDRLSHPLDSAGAPDTRTNIQWMNEQLTWN